VLRGTARSQEGAELVVAIITYFATR